jgi:ketosteroid isomerase-like protein
MKRILLAFVCSSAILLAGGSETAVRKLIDDFATAVLKKDNATLDKLIADSVTYSHSNGKVETKAEALAAFKTAKYEKWEYKEQKMQFFGNTALVRGDVEILNTASNPAPIKLNLLQVWAKTPKGWQLVARQATRLP